MCRLCRGKVADCIFRAPNALKYTSNTSFLGCCKTLGERTCVSSLFRSSRNCQKLAEKHLHFFSSLLAYGHRCHTPVVPLVGRQCHIHLSFSRSAPAFTASKPYLLPVVSFFVASSAKVPFISVAQHVPPSFTPLRLLFLLQLSLSV